MLAAMPKSFYKGEPLGSRPPCAICMGRGEGERAQLLLPGGVSVWLCAAHRSQAFQRSRAGRDFHVTLSYVWQAAGCLTARRRRALEVHRQRLLRQARGPAPRPRPAQHRGNRTAPRLGVAQCHHPVHAAGTRGLPTGG